MRKALMMATATERVVRQITLRGIRPIMFDRYAGGNDEKLPDMEKLYVGKGGALIMPAANILSFLSAENTESAPKRLLGLHWRAVAKAALSFCFVEPEEIPFTRNGKPLNLDNAGIIIDRRVARLPKGIPNPKSRPVLSLPWELSFGVTLFPNKDLSENTLKGLFVDGGICIGLGTYRGVYGKFEMSRWK